MSLLRLVEGEVYKLEERMIEERDILIDLSFLNDIDFGKMEGLGFLLW